MEKRKFNVGDEVIINVDKLSGFTETENQMKIYDYILNHPNESYKIRRFITSPTLILDADIELDHPLLSKTSFYEDELLLKEEEKQEEKVMKEFIVEGKKIKKMDVKEFTDFIKKMDLSIYYSFAEDWNGDELSWWYGMKKEYILDSYYPIVSIDYYGGGSPGIFTVDEEIEKSIEHYFKENNLKHVFVQLEKELNDYSQESEYLIFVLGYDLVKERIDNLYDLIEDEPLPCDYAFSLCKEIYNLYLKSKWNDENSNCSAYESLSNFCEELADKEIVQLIKKIINK